MKKRIKESEKDKNGKVPYVLAVLFFLFIFCFSAWQLLKYVWEWTESWKVTDTVIQKAVVIEETEEQKEKEYAPITVDFDSLRQENEDIVAWIYCPDTVINYPVVQAEDNDYYLHRLLNGKTNPAGSLFLDYRNASDFSEVGSIIYGHHMKNNSMFGTLTDYQDQAYYDAHPVMYLLTPEQDYKVEVYLGYVAQDNAEVYSLPMNEERKARVLIDGMSRTTFRSQVGVDDGDRLLILSTCTYEYDDARYLLIGLLRELDRK